MTAGPTDTILVIDDDADLQALLKVRLEQGGWATLRAMSAADGLATARAAQPSLILLDLKLEGLTGLEVCHALKSDPATAPIPVIFLSSEKDEATKAAALDHGAVDYLEKNVSPVELFARVRAALRARHYQAQLEAMAHLDPLTSLYNRGHFVARLQEEVAAANRYHRPFGILMLDLDGFKAVNDTLGHPAGDRLLVEVAKTLSTCTRKSDVLARLGGDEFAILLREIEERQVLEVAERIREAVAGLRMPAWPPHLRVTTSIGAWSTLALPSKVVPPHDFILEAADRLLYAAKRAGRNQIAV